jgi:hypothetical protein
VHGKSLKFTCTYFVPSPPRDVPGIKKLFPTLRPGADEEFSDQFVRAESILLAYGVGIKAVFSEETRGQVHTMLTEARQQGGTARIFGFDIGPSGKTLGRNVSFNDITWDKETGSLEIPPVNDGYPSLLGVLGRRI